MRAEIQLSRWENFIGQMEECEKQLLSEIAELEELQGSIRRTGNWEGMQDVLRSLKSSTGGMREQARKVRDMKTVLERVGRLYGKCEERIIQAAEGTGTKRFKETWKRADLKWLEEKIHVLLK